MAALTGPRNTPAMGGQPLQLSIPLAANAKVWKGGMVAVVAGYGTAAAAAAGAGTFVVGIAQQSVDNAGGANGALSVNVMCEEAFLLAGSGLAQTNLEATVYATDDQTITTTAGTNSKVGTIIQFVSATSAWVYIGVPR